MKMQEIRKIAKKNGLRSGKLNKTLLVKHIQISEGNFDCFSSASNDYCDQSNCIWKEDCFNLARKKAA
ncbi:SAP domain-containing protein [sulfur-oxidizing endosymbiont of Gigantopelta aegis]|uniref:SAP domain-containing protein n=1 Tax=sulfur-oxidizing endosymbiont of Gigantopelta aegis TaxID=2794934 RepID=UPI0018DC8FFE|nr:SAP domain-containing protein [sulfur-oxidizing endosymbiont of Gigantopelta aegis]